MDARLPFADPPGQPAPRGRRPGRGRRSRSSSIATSS